MIYDHNNVRVHQNLLQDINIGPHEINIDTLVSEYS